MAGGHIVSNRLPRFSVICPTYQSGPRLAETIVSVLRQSLGDLELLIGDDGSTDGTATVADEFAIDDERVRVYRLARSGDPGRVREQLVARASGDFIAYVDHDDLFHEDHLADLERVLDSERPIAVTGARYRYDDPAVGGFSRSGEHWSPEVAIIDPVAEPSRVAHSRELLDVATWRRAAGGLEDWDLWWRLAARGISFTALDEISVTVRLHDGSRRHGLRQRPTMLFGYADHEAPIEELVDVLRRDLIEPYQRDLADWHPALARAAASSGAGGDSPEPPSWFSPSALPGGPRGWLLGFFAPVVDRAHAAAIGEVMRHRFPRLVAAASAAARSAPMATTVPPTASYPS